MTYAEPIQHQCFFFPFRFMACQVWAESIVSGGENGRSLIKTAWPPTSRTWLTCDQREARSHSGASISGHFIWNLWLFQNNIKCSLMSDHPYIYLIKKIILMILSFSLLKQTDLGILCVVLAQTGPGHAKNKGVDQPAHLCNLISTFVVPCLDSMICILALSKVSRF